MKRMILLAMLMALAVPRVAMSQDDRFPECEFESTRDILAEHLSAVSTWDDLISANSDIGESLAFCQGLVFEGTGDQVVGPVDIAPGVYTLTVMGDGPSVDGEILSGDCNSLFAFVESSQTSTQEAFRSEGCSMLITVDASAAWSFEFAVVQSFGMPTPEDAEAMWEALFDGDLQVGNSYICRPSQATESDVADFTGLNLASVECEYEGFEMACSLTTESGNQQTSLVARSGLSDGKFCDFEFE